MSMVIKTDGSRGPAYGAQTAPFNLEDVADKASSYLEQIRIEAAQIIVRAKEDAESVRRHAQQQGYQQAVEEAELRINRRVQQQVATLIPALKQAISGVKEVREQCLQHWQHRVIGLAVAIAGRIVRRELTQHSEITVTLVREALELAAGNAQVHLHLNPDDHATLQDRFPDFAQQFPHLSSTDIVADPAVGPGGCVVKTEFGEIDQTIEAQLARIEEELVISH